MQPLGHQMDVLQEDPEAVAVPCVQTRLRHLVLSLSQRDVVPVVLSWKQFAKLIT